MSDLLVGDRVRVASEGSEHDGRRGWLSCVDSGALFYLDTGDGDDLLGPFARGELVELVHCEWFLRCTNEATATARAPFGEVPVCERCLEFATS